MNTNNIWRSLAYIIATFLASPAVHAEISIAVVGPISGSSLAIGEQMELGAQKAVDHLNANGGLLGEQVALTSLDDACEPDQAEAVARQLVSEGVKFVVGHACSGASIAAMGIYEKAGIIMMSPASTNPRFTEEGGRNVFRVIGRDDQQGVIAADYMANNFADSNIAILHDGNAYSLGLTEITKQKLNENGVTEAMFDRFLPEQTEYTSMIDKLVAAEIDTVYGVGNQYDVAILLREAKARLPDLFLISSDSLVGEEFVYTAGEAGIGTYFTFGPDFRTKPEAASIVEAFREEDAFEPEGYTLYSYSVIQAWSQAVQQAGTIEFESVIAALQTGSFDTVIGKIGFDDEGDVTGVDNFIWYVFEEDKYVPAE